MKKVVRFSGILMTAFVVLLTGCRTYYESIKTDKGIGFKGYP